jgi:signal recognition particle subunit SRP54
MSRCRWSRISSPAVKEKAVGEEVIGSLTPGQALVGVVHRELTALMGEAQRGLNLATQPPAVVS